jgi:hypothetical protein
LNTTLASCGAEQNVVIVVYVVVNKSSSEAAFQQFVLELIGPA